MPNYYDILGVPKNASQEDIKAAYRKIVKTCHPDLCADESKKAEMEAKFKEVSEAYDTLSDPQKRRDNDMGVPPGWRKAGNANHTRSYTVNFGGRGSPRGGNFTSFGFGNIPGEPPLEINVPISLEDLHSGSDIPIRYERNESCSPCSGAGFINVADVVPCSTCNGTGRFVLGGMMNIVSICGICNGTGKRITNPCTGCSGRGAVKKIEKADLRINKGMRPGEVLMVSGKGNYSPTEKAHGDLYVRLQLAPHKFYTVDFPDIRCIVPITYRTAVMGGTVRVPTIDGVYKLTIPPGTSHGTVMRMKGKGLQTNVRAAYRGGQLVSVEIDIPKGSPEFDSVFDVFEKDLDHFRVKEYEDYLDGMT